MPPVSRSRSIPTEGIDPALVPYRTLSSGTRVPAIGLGTFDSDHPGTGASARRTTKRIAPHERIITKLDECPEALSHLDSQIYPYACLHVGIYRTGLWLLKPRS